jgi:anthraniloyl-CoA monooxygenase
MRIVCIGGGPAGLAFALLAKRLAPGHDIVVVERCRRDEAWDAGLVLSDATRAGLRRLDADTADAIEAALVRWDDVVLEFKGRSLRAGGQGLAGIARRRLLDLLRARCEAAGVRLEFEREVGPDAEPADADLVVAADGAGSLLRQAHADVLRPDIDVRPNRLLRLRTNKACAAPTFVFERTGHGWLQAHACAFGGDGAEFIVDCPPPVWLALGLDTLDADARIALLERVFARHLQGAALAVAPHSPAWRNFQDVRCARWWVAPERGAPLVLVGDAARTTHFAIGSGGSAALDDAMELARQLGLADAARDPAPALDRYQARRTQAALRQRDADRNAMTWFEDCGARYCDAFEPEQLLYSLLTRGQHVGHEALRRRDADGLEIYERWFAQRGPANGTHGEPWDAVAPRAVVAPGQGIPPMFTPFTVRSVTLKNRIVVAPMAQYSAVAGLVGDYHLVHLGARALGGAALVMAEMTAVSADARITPGCPGLYTEAQGDAWARIVDWVHTHGDARIGVQLGHAGAKGSTHLGWEGLEQPLASGGWPLIAASSQQALPGVSDWTRAMTRADMDRVLHAFVLAARRAAEAGFDWLELHCGHGYLLASFLSPLANQRADAYGGTPDNRLRYPLEVFAAVRAAWPADLPMSVRLSAHDAVDGAITPADAVQVARAFKAAGADMIACSSGLAGRPPLSDRIRNEAGIATIATGAIDAADAVDGLVAAGRADLGAVGRPHLANPAWTLAEAARLGYRPVQWPAPYRSARKQLEEGFERDRAGPDDLAR